MQELALHILDLVENSLRANASIIELTIKEDKKNDLLIIIIKDNGMGMDKNKLKNIMDPFYTTKPDKRIGLGLALFAQAARESGGTMKLESEPGKGMKIKATFKLSHPDRKPIGNIDETMYVLKETHPEVKFIFNINGIQ